MSDIETITLTLSENIKEKFVAYDDHLAEIARLQARIDELGKGLSAQQKLTAKGIYYTLEELSHYKNKWKAEGVREMMEEVFSKENPIISERDILEYADKLEGK